MRFSLRRRDSGPLSQNEAWFCCSSNFILPGSGSLLGGRWSGYPQLLLGLAGFGLSTWFGLRFLLWFTQHWREIWAADHDPAEILTAIWLPGRWIALGFVLFAAAWLWALGTSIALLRATRHQPPPAPPPIQTDQAASG